MLCEMCGREYAELHHIQFRSQVPALVNSKINHIYLCPYHHRSHAGVHGRDGHQLDKKLKLEFQNKLEILFDKEYLSKEEINQVFNISERCLNRLLKVLNTKDGLYNREDVIRAACGGRLII